MGSTTRPRLTTCTGTGSCGRSRIIGQLWEELQDNFFPDMKAGGPCMKGLSPEAKAFMFEQRTEWLFRDRDGSNEETDQ